MTPAILRPCLKRRLLVLLFCLTATACFILGVCISVVILEPERSGLRCSESKQSEPDGPEYKLVVLVLTAPDNVERRDTLRATWLRPRGGSPPPARHWFVLGGAALPAEQHSRLLAEQSRHGDLLILPHVTDAYTQLTEKVLAAFVWLAAHSRHQYVMKCDDDTFARLGPLLTELESAPRSRFYMGFFDGRARPRRTGKWAEPSWDICDLYLPYALGGGYILSSDLVSYLATAAPHLRRFNSEDVSVGAWLAPLAIDRRHDPRFDTEWESRGCDNRHLVTHKHSVAQMTEMHRTLERRGVLCDKEKRIRGSYVYNASVPPSQCCKRVTDTSLP
ncbi:beta-1,3-galactosyltransferase 6-like [Amphibalanus amphitrite]|uniref:beta-1,3-galactosyltransferase 6-like n=1 Tax=Amphibalanus amphitrite TaxID=1232801 RepID=UPI001C914CC4|nr:beta-1,3-galactosyltransferase 6-like [Amphibalanus amphitrite]XP_043222112.1 beta-1,3-galactosyltransferase 6-like [Amphibalanus amphitrite]XP_043222113.1 beta-1,3-galactosyltransferase 6-like [Amphibalanus amphitrite]XP_043222114.1 beta-1,3-galactosyltransferase 6-like [Amphibalanus amphitrite]